jgi:tRNA1Val (adenine37-N6)-methyltransferase
MIVPPSSDETLDTFSRQRVNPSAIASLNLRLRSRQAPGGSLSLSADSGPDRGRDKQGLILSDTSDPVLKAGVRCRRSIKVLQKKTGYRFSIDAVLLSQFTKIRKNEKVIDLGTGCGILPLLLCHDTQAHSFVGVEIQKDLAELAKRNVLLNHFEDRISILRNDFRKLKTVFPPGSFHVVLSNPPYRKYRTGRVNPSLEKAIARHEIKGTLEDLVSMASYLLPPKGRCYLIFPALRTVDLLVALRNRRLEPKRLQFVYPRLHEEANFILTESVKASGVELRVMDPLILQSDLS